MQKFIKVFRLNCRGCENKSNTMELKLFFGAFSYLCICIKSKCSFQAVECDSKKC